MKKPKYPSQQAVAMVLQAADSSPRMNGEASRRLDAAVSEVGQYFHSLYNPPPPKKKG